MASVVANESSVETKSTIAWIAETSRRTFSAPHQTAIFVGHLHAYRCRWLRWRRVTHGRRVARSTLNDFGRRRTGNISVRKIVSGFRECQHYPLARWAWWRWRADRLRPHPAVAAYAPPEPPMARLDA